MQFHVYDSDGNEVTDDREWFLSSDGTLYYFTDDIFPLVEAGDDYWYGD